MSFLGGLFGGSNPSLNSDINQSAGLASFLNNTGTADVAAASDYSRALLSGDWSKIMPLLAPRIAAIQKQAQNQRMQLANTNTRSGGVTESQIAAGDKANADVNDLVTGLTSSALSTTGSMGENLLAQGANALDMNAKFSQEQMDNWKKSILGSAITGGVGALTSFGTGAAFGALPGGPGASAGGQGALATFLNG